MSQVDFFPFQEICCFCRPAGAAPLFAICGRPNVGKSTLFNRLTKSRRSIVGDEPGITRDRIYGEVEWGGKVARIVDTGGIVPDDEALIPTEIFNQAKVALEEASAIVMVVDGRTELASPDIELARLLIRSGKPIFLAVNKIDTEAMKLRLKTFAGSGSRSCTPFRQNTRSASAICLKLFGKCCRGLRRRTRKQLKKMMNSRLSKSPSWMRMVCPSKG